MAYLGNPPAEAYTNTVKDSFSGDGSTVAFTMSLPTTTNNVRVVVENVIQDPTVAYSCSGTTLTFTSAPPSGTNNIYVVHLGPAVMTTVPPTEITEATTYTSDLTVQGAFTSQGIDDNATSTAMTLDSGGNLLVGKTSAATNVEGGELRENGQVLAVATNVNPFFGARLGSDGDIAVFRKDTTTVGAISSVNGASIVVYGDTGIRFGGDGYLPVDSSGSLTDNAVDFGNGSWRYKDLYLSGGVYLGGTGSANYLEDYEEGTWTPVYTSDSTNPTFTPNLQNGRYTKIGRTVIASFRLRGAITGTKTGTLRISGLPFTSAGDSAGSGGSIRLTENFGSTAYPASLAAGNNTTEIIPTTYDSSDARSGLFTLINVSTTSASSSGNYILGQVVYDIA